MNVDLYFFNLINGFSGRWAWLDCLAIFFAKYLAYILVITLIIVTYALGEMEMFLASFLAAFFSRFVVNESIYFLYKRERPSVAVGAKVLLKNPKYPSFPSGHTSFFFALSFSILPYNFGLGIIFIILSLCIAFFRIFSGLHWPSDILGGAGAGAVSSLLVYFYLIPWILFSL